MHSLTVNGLHLVFALIGFLLVHRFAVSPRYSNLLWPFTLIWGTLTAAIIFVNTQPGLEFIF